MGNVQPMEKEDVLIVKTFICLTFQQHTNLTGQACGITETAHTYRLNYNTVTIFSPQFTSHHASY